MDRLIKGKYHSAYLLKPMNGHDPIHVHDDGTTEPYKVVVSLEPIDDEAGFEGYNLRVAFGRCCVARWSEETIINECPDFSLETYFNFYEGNALNPDIVRNGLDKEIYDLSRMGYRRG